MGNSLSRPVSSNQPSTALNPFYHQETSRATQAISTSSTLPPRPPSNPQGQSTISSSAPSNCSESSTPRQTMAEAVSPPRKRRPTHSLTEAESPSKKLLENPDITDRLGTLVNKMSALLSTSATWEDFVHTVHGPSYLSKSIDTIHHPAKHLLTSYRDHGVPVELEGPSW